MQAKFWHNYSRLLTKNEKCTNLGDIFKTVYPPVSEASKGDIKFEWTKKSTHLRICHQFLKYFMLK